MIKVFLSYLFLFLFSVCAWSTKARLESVSDSFHRPDSQFVFSNSLELMRLDDSIIYESGIASATSRATGAEAMWIHTISESAKVAVSVGHRDKSVSESRTLMNIISGQSYQLPQNPLHFFYTLTGDSVNLGFGLFYSEQKDRVNRLGEHSSGFSGAIELGNLQMAFLYAITNGVVAGGSKKFDGSGSLFTELKYAFDSTDVKVQLNSANSHSFTGLTENESHRIDRFSVAFVDKRTKAESDFFFGARFLTEKINCHVSNSVECGKQLSATFLPFWFGFESKVNDWLTLRSSVQQSIIFGQIKDDFGYPTGVTAYTIGGLTDEISPRNDTFVKLGTGIHFNNLTLDGVIATNTQVINTANFLSQLSLNYRF